MSTRSIYDPPPAEKVAATRAKPLVTEAGPVVGAVETVFRTVRESTTSAQNEVRNAVSSVTSMFPDVPTEVKAYLPDTNGITLPDVQFSDIPTSQVQFTALVDKTAGAAQDRAAFVMSDPVSRELAIKTAVIGTAGIAALIGLRKRHAIIKYAGAAAAATTVAAAANPEHSVPLIKTGGAKVAAQISSLYAELTAPKPEAKRPTPASDAAAPAATPSTSTSSTAAEPPAAAAAIAETNEALEAPEESEPGQESAGGGSGDGADSVWNQARSAVGWSIDNSGSAPSAKSAVSKDVAAAGARVDATAAEEAVDVTAEVAALGAVAATDEETQTATKATKAAVDMGQSKKEDIDTYPSRR